MIKNIKLILGNSKEINRKVSNFVVVDDVLATGGAEKCETELLL